MEGGSYALSVRGEQVETKPDPTDRLQQHRPDTSTDQMSQGRHLEGETHFDAGAMQSLDQRI